MFMQILTNSTDCMFAPPQYFGFLYVGPGKIIGLCCRHLWNRFRTFIMSFWMVNIFKPAHKLTPSKGSVIPNLKVLKDKKFPDTCLYGLSSSFRVRNPS